ncbi:fungal hydrophobin [Lanmaoa asiatica]|nr:fungal hydrophobin [Lanmaoa asiatica]
MFTRFSALLSVAALAAVAAAAPSVLEARVSQCDTGPIKCCKTVTTAGDPAVTPLLGLLGIVIGDINAVVGLNCSPVTVIGLGDGAVCEQQPLCCTDVYQDGLVNAGCTPIGVNL